MFSFKTFATGFSMPVWSELELCVPSVTGLLDALESSVGDRFAIFKTKLIIGLDFATTRSSSPGFSCCLFDMVFGILNERKWQQENIEKLMMLNKRRSLLHSSRVKLFLVRHYLRAAGRAEIADVEQTEKMIPLITGEIAFRQPICELVFGVNIFDL